MNQKYLEQVADLHRRAFTVDAHFDLAYGVGHRRERGEQKVIENNYLPQFKSGGFDLIISVIFVDDYFLPEMGLRRALGQINHLHDDLAESPGRFRICRSAAEARTARKEGEIALILSMEGADPLQNDIGLLKTFYELGVRGLGLVWSRRNYAADGAFFSEVREGRKGGLTPFGAQLVEKAEELGIFVDVSHLNDEGFWDVLDIAKRPLIASHSNCMNSIDVFIRDDEPDVRVSHFVDHVDHIVKIGGVEHVGLGFDLCDGFKDYLHLGSVIESTDVIKTHAGLGEFTQELIIRGYSDDHIIAILGGNFMRVFSEILD